MDGRSEAHAAGAGQQPKVDSSRESSFTQSLEVCYINTGNVRALGLNDVLVLEDSVGNGKLRCEVMFTGGPEPATCIKPLTTGCFVNGTSVPVEREEDTPYPIAPGAVIVVGSKRFQLRFRKSKAVGQRRLPATPGQQTKSTLPRKRTRRHQKAVNLSQQQPSAGDEKDSGQPNPQGSGMREGGRKDNLMRNAEQKATSPTSPKPVGMQSASLPSSGSQTFSATATDQKRKSSYTGSLGGWVMDMFSVMIWDPSAESEPAVEESSELEIADQVAEVLSHQLIISNPATASSLIDRVFRALEDASGSCEEALKMFLQSWSPEGDSAANMNAVLELVEAQLSFGLEDVDTWLGTLLLLQSRFVEVPGITVPRTLVGMVVGFLLAADSASVLKLACKLIQEWSLQEVHIPNGTGDILCVVLRTNDSSPDVAACVCELLVTLASLYPDIEEGREGMQQQSRPVLEEMMRDYSRHDQLQKWATAWLATSEQRKRKSEKRKRKRIPGSASAGDLDQAQETGRDADKSKSKPRRRSQGEAPSDPKAGAPQKPDRLGPLSGRKAVANADTAEQVVEESAQPVQPRRALPTAPQPRTASSEPESEPERSEAAKETAQLHAQPKEQTQPVTAASPDVANTSSASTTPLAEENVDVPANEGSPIIATASTDEPRTSSDPVASPPPSSSTGAPSNAHAGATVSSEEQTSPPPPPQDPAQPEPADTENAGDPAAQTEISHRSQDEREVDTPASVSTESESPAAVSAPDATPSVRSGSELELERPRKVEVTLAPEADTQGDAEDSTAADSSSAQLQVQILGSTGDEGKLTPRTRRRNQWGDSTSPLPAVSPLSPLSPLATGVRTTVQHEEEVGLQEVEAEHEDVASCLSRRTMGVRLARQRWDTGELMLAVRTAFQLHADADVAGYLDVLSMLLKQIYRWPHEVIVEAMTSLGSLNLSTLSPRHVELACSLMTVLSERLLLPPDGDAVDSGVQEEEFLVCLTSALETTDEFFSHHTSIPEMESEWRKAWMAVHTLNQRLNLGKPS